MADEAAVNVVMRMRDEASDDLARVGGTMANTETQALQLNLALTSVGAAFSAVGALVNQLDNPMAKMAATFLMTAGAMMTTVSAIIQMIPYIRQLITWIRNLAIAQAVLQALSGPKGWITLGVGLALAGGAAAGITAMSGGFGGGGGGTTNVVNINAGVLMGDETQARQLSQMVKRNIDEDTRLGR